jgi:hypothetical protein
VHTHHAGGSKGSDCVACHMPKIEVTIKDNFVSAHTFRFITPTETEQSGIPNPCTSCHSDKSTAWAKSELKGWSSTSPWRVAQWDRPAIARSRSSGQRLADLV